MMRDETAERSPVGVAVRVQALRDLDTLGISVYAPQPIKCKSQPSTVFGATLEHILENSSAVTSTGLRVPNFLIQLAEVIEAGIETEGLFRKCGSSKRMNDGMAKLNAGEETAKLQVHDAAGLLKAFLRELPEPLFPSNLYEAFVEVQTVPRTGRADALSLLFLNFPAAHLDAARFMFDLFGLVAEGSEVNQMSPSNLANVLAPNILRGAAGSVQPDVYDEKELREHATVVSIVEALIRAPEIIGRVPDSTADVAAQIDAGKAETLYCSLLRPRKKKKKSKRKPQLTPTKSLHQLHHLADVATKSPELEVPKTTEADGFCLY